jgi:hypothetical protein
VEQQIAPVIIDAKPEIKKEPAIQEIVDSLKSIADDIGQISELSSEEKILVSQFFISLLKLMQPLAPSIVVSETAIPRQLGDVAKAYVDTTGNLVLQFQDGHLEVKNLSDPKNRDLMTTVISDILPKFKNLTSNQKRKIENRIKLLTSVTKEIQKSSEALYSVYNTEK